MVVLFPCWKHLNVNRIRINNRNTTISGGDDCRRSWGKAQNKI